MVVADSSVWIAYFTKATSPETDLLDDLLARERVVMGDLILIEVLQGFRSESEYRAARAMLEILPFREMVGKEIAVAAALNYRLLRTRGITVRKTIDMLVGTFCIQNGLRLLHDDRDFDPMQAHLGLQVLRPKVAS